MHYIAVQATLAVAPSSVLGLQYFECPQVASKRLINIDARMLERFQFSIFNFQL